MPYKDAEKQREANLRAQHKRRGKLVAIVGNAPVTPDDLSHLAVTPPKVRYSYSKEWYKGG